MAESLPGLYNQFTPALVGATYGLQAFADLAQGILGQQRAKKIAAYNADVLTANAEAAAQAQELEALQQERAAAMAEQDRLLVQQAGAYNEARRREQYDRINAETRAIVASSGLLLSGSPLRVYEDSIRQQERDVLAERYQVALQQRAAGEQATQARYGAALSRYAAQERLRIGAGQAALARASADTSQLAAGLSRLGSTLLQGTGATLSALERGKAQGPTLPTYAYTRATTPAHPYILKGG